MHRFLRSRDTTGDDHLIYHLWQPYNTNRSEYRWRRELFIESYWWYTDGPFADVPTLSALKDAATDTEYKSLVASIPADRKHKYHH